MTDFTYLPNDLWREVAKFLSPKDYKALLLVSQFFNTKVSTTACFLQPVYNRLYALDPSLPALLPIDEINAMNCFCTAAEKILARHQVEVEYLQGGMYAPNKMPSEYLEKLHLRSATIEQLEENSAILDEVNSQIIRTNIDAAMTSTNLGLQFSRLTRFPESLIKEPIYAEYFKKLTSLDLTSNNIQNFDFSSLDKLTTLDCSLNNLQSFKIPSSLTDFMCAHNCIQELDLSKLNQLTALYCNNNLLQSLILPKGNNLVRLNCSKNKLQTLDLSHRTALNALCIDFKENPLEDLNIEGTSAGVQYRFSNFETKLLFKQLEKHFFDNNKRQESVARLGERANYSSCLWHLGFMKTNLIFCEPLIGFAAPLIFSPTNSAEQPSLKRERDENEEPGNPIKRRKK